MEKTNETKQKLFEAACRVFREKTYEKAKISDIVGEAEVAQGTFYLYFKSKKECLNELLTELIQNFLTEIENEFAEIGEDSAFHVTEKILSAIDAHAAILAIMHFEQHNLDETVTRMHKSIHSRTMSLLHASILYKGVERKSADIKASLIDALIKQYLMSNVYITDPEFNTNKQETLDMIRVVIDGVY